jgi:hypothetical protein
MEGGFKGEAIYNKKIDAHIRKLKKKIQLLRNYILWTIDDEEVGRHEQNYIESQAKKVLKETEGD